jgi:hypothetical protein
MVAQGVVVLESVTFGEYETNASHDDEDESKERRNYVQNEEADEAKKTKYVFIIPRYF